MANKCIFNFWINLSGVKGFIYIDKNNKNKIKNKYLYFNGCHFCTFRTEVSSTRGFNNLFNILSVQNTRQKMLRTKQSTLLSAPQTRGIILAQLFESYPPNQERI